MLFFKRKEITGLPWYAYAIGGAVLLFWGGLIGASALRIWWGEATGVDADFSFGGGKKKEEAPEAVVAKELSPEVQEAIRRQGGVHIAPVDTSDFYV